VAHTCRARRAAAVNGGWPCRPRRPRRFLWARGLENDDGRDIVRGPRRRGAPA
jgi:hypothetical protein